MRKLVFQKLTSCNMIIFGYIHLPANVLFLFYLKGKKTLLCKYSVSVFFTLSCVGDT